MKISIEQTGKRGFTANTQSGHTVVMDASPEVGGDNQGPRPMEMLLMGMGGCTAIDVTMILEKSRQEVTNCQVNISAERADTDPNVFTDIHVHFVIQGRNINSKKVQQAIELSAEKYCSASIMLGKTANIQHDFEIVEV
jgi:putative redox protein